MDFHSGRELSQANSVVPLTCAVMEQQNQVLKVIVTVSCDHNSHPQFPKPTAFTRPLFVLQEEGEDTASSLSTPSSDPVDRESEGAVAEHVSPVSRDEYTGSIAYRAEMKHLAKQDENKPVKVREKSFLNS